MNVTQVTDGSAPALAPATRRIAVIAVTALAAAGAGLLVHATVYGARFELIGAVFGLAAGAALVGVLVLTPGGRLSIVRDDDA
jgi:hypothetical protein